MGNALDRLFDKTLPPPDEEIALSMISRVKAYTRRGKDGSTVHVDAYSRTLSSMTVPELHLELANTPSLNRMKYSQISNEIRRREEAAERVTKADLPDMSMQDLNDTLAALPDRRDTIARRAMLHTEISNRMAADIAKGRGPRPDPNVPRTVENNDVLNEDGSPRMGRGFVVVGEGAGAVRPARDTLAEAVAEMPKQPGFSVWEFEDGKLVKRKPYANSALEKITNAENVLRAQANRNSVDLLSRETVVEALTKALGRGPTPDELQGALTRLNRKGLYRF
jgi:hypothetical protein